MSTVVQAPPTRRTAVSSRHRTAVLPLAAVEGRRLVLHPISIGGFLFSAALFTVSTWNHAPVLQRDDVWIAMSVLPMAGATLLAANLAALRSRRDDTDELFDSRAATRTQRTQAHLLSVLWAVGAAVAFEVGALAFLASNQAVGSPSPLELLGGPAVVAAGGAFGVAMAAWWPTVFAGPVALVGVAGLQVLLLTRRPPGPTLTEVRWLALWVVPSNSGDPAPELLIRPVGWHLLYLLGLSAGLAVVALARSRPSARVLPFAAVAVALTLLGASVATRPPSAAQRDRLVSLVDHPELHQVCRTIAGVRYCAYPGYAGWIDRWAAAITPVLSRVPGDARPSGLTVRQNLGPLQETDLPESEMRLSYRTDPFTGVPLSPLPAPAIYPGPTWGRGGGEGLHQLGMALVASVWAVGLPRSPDDIHLTRADIQRLLQGTEAPTTPPKVGEPFATCQTAGQARAVVAIWLAGQASPGAERALRTIVAQDLPEIVTYPQGGYTDYGPYQQALSSVETLVTGVQGTELELLAVQWTRVETNYALQLLDRPHDRVAAAIGHDWTELTNPSTSSSRLVTMFGLRPFPTHQQQLAAAGIPPDPRAEDPLAGTIPCR